MCADSEYIIADELSPKMVNESPACLFITVPYLLAYDESCSTVRSPLKRAKMDLPSILYTSAENANSYFSGKGKAPVLKQIQAKYP